MTLSLASDYNLATALSGGGYGTAETAEAASCEIMEDFFFAKFRNNSAGRLKNASGKSKK